MNTAHRNDELVKARRELESARCRLAAIKAWGDKKRQAAEQVEYWTGRVSFLSCLKG